MGLSVCALLPHLLNLAYTGDGQMETETVRTSSPVRVLLSGLCAGERQEVYGFNRRNGTERLGSGTSQRPLTQQRMSSPTRDTQKCSRERCKSQ